MKTSQIIYFLFFSILVSCNNQSQYNVDILYKDSLGKSNTDTIPIADTLQTQIELQKVIIERLNKRDSFLLKPFDLYNFKKKVGQSNSGNADKRDYRFKPEYKGIYYSFFLFSRLKGYLGTCKLDTISREDGLIIITYKPLGKYQYDYFDPTEELIEVEAKFNDYYLPELAFVGLNKTEIKAQLGEPTFEKNNCFVYTFRNRALILNFKNGRVNWLKYIHLKSELTSDKKFDQLFLE